MAAFSLLRSSDFGGEEAAVDGVFASSPISLVGASLPATEEVSVTLGVFTADVFFSKESGDPAGDDRLDPVLSSREEVRDTVAGNSIVEGGTGRGATEA